MTYVLFVSLILSLLFAFIGGAVCMHEHLTGRWFPPRENGSEWQTRIRQMCRDEL